MTVQPQLRTAFISFSHLSRRVIKWRLFNRNDDCPLIYSARCIRAREGETGPHTGLHVWIETEGVGEKRHARARALRTGEGQTGPLFGGLHVRNEASRGEAQQYACTGTVRTGEG